MEIHVLVEEEPAEAALGILVPRILNGRAGHHIITFRGKQDLLGKLPQRPAGYRRRLEHELKEAGYDLPVFPKIKVAREVAEHMEPARNRSPSFRAFCAGLESFLT